MERIDAIVRDPLFQECLGKNKRAERDREFCKHDLQHFVDVARIAYILMLESGDLRQFIQENQLSGPHAAKEVIYAAGILHDIGRWQEYESGEDHAPLGAELAGQILPRAGFTPGEIRVITQAIYEHREQRTQMTRLGEILHRADNLSRACHECSVQDKCYKFPTMETGNLVLIY
ncbi:MAG: HD domain-containing protein [Firmicutes bacterium]|nr:HD domain-containing protein [Bacillota bacterium]